MLLCISAPFLIEGLRLVLCDMIMRLIFSPLLILRLKFVISTAPDDSSTSVLMPDSLLSLESRDTVPPSILLECCSVASRSYCWMLSLGSNLFCELRLE